MEMAAADLRKVKRVLTEGGAIYVRGSLGDIARYDSIAQWPGEHERTSPEGTVLSVSIDSSSIIPGGMHLDPLASSIERYQKLFLSRTGYVHGKYHTVFAFQFPLSSAGKSPSSLGQPQPDLSLGGRSVMPAQIEQSSAPSTSVSDWTWIASPIKWWHWDMSWCGFWQDARRTPVIFLLGKVWARSWDVPYVQFPL